MPESLVISGSGLSISGDILLNPFYGVVPRGNAFYAGNATGSGETTYTFVVPSNVNFISYVAIGGGGAGWVQLSGTKTALGGHGGGLAYRNNVPVTPGQTVTVVVGNSAVRTFGDGLTIANAPNSSVTVNGVSTIAAGAYNQLYAGGTDGRGYPAGTYNGGALGGYSLSGGGSGEAVIVAGGGAAGYTQNGGDASVVNTYSSNLAGNAAVTGGGGGGGGSSMWQRKTGAANIAGAGGGGVNVYGLGIDGAGGTLTARNGGGGSYNVGTPQLNNGNAYVVTSTLPSNSIRNNGGLYGGGGGSYFYSNTLTPASNMVAGRGGPGAVRIVWGFRRAFPSTDVSDDITGNDAVVYL